MQDIRKNHRRRVGIMVGAEELLLDPHGLLGIADKGNFGRCGGVGSVRLRGEPGMEGEDTWEE